MSFQSVPAISLRAVTPGMHKVPDPFLDYAFVARLRPGSTTPQKKAAITGW